MSQKNFQLGDGAQAEQKQSPTRSNSESAPRTFTSPYLTTAEAAVYLRFRSTSGIRSLVARGELHPIGRGPRQTLLFTPVELDRWLASRYHRRVVCDAQHATLGEQGIVHASARKSDQVSECHQNQRGDVSREGQSQRSSHRPLSGDRQAHHGGERPSSSQGTSGSPSDARTRSPRRSEQPPSNWCLRQLVAGLQDKVSRSPNGGALR